MGLVTLSEVLKESVQKKYAVGAFDSVDYMFTETILEAAEEKNTPVILMIAEVSFPAIKKPEQYFRYTLDMIHNTKVPVALLLDHGSSYDICMQALHYGFTGVMFDGSALPNDENIAITRKVVQAAHACGVSVEAEIGHVGGHEAGHDGPSDADESMYTKPADAVDFYEKTNVDSLAIAIGTVHGVYRGTPKLDLARLDAIRLALPNVPLALHGGSGLSDAAFRSAVEHGINKINFFTGMSLAASKEAAEFIRAREGQTAELHYHDINAVAHKRAKAVVQDAISTFGTLPLL